jgi:hypothetical protein
MRIGRHRRHENRDGGCLYILSKNWGSDRGKLVRVTALSGTSPYPPKSVNLFLVSFVERDQTNSNG